MPLQQGVDLALDKILKEPSLDPEQLAKRDALMSKIDSLSQRMKKTRIQPTRIQPVGTLPSVVPPLESLSVKQPPTQPVSNDLAQRLAGNIKELLQGTSPGVTVTPSNTYVTTQGEITPVKAPAPQATGTVRPPVEMRAYVPQPGYTVKPGETDIGGMLQSALQSLWRETPLNPYYFKSKEEKQKILSIDTLTKTAKQLGVTNPEEWAKQVYETPRQGEISMRARQPTVGETPIPNLPTLGVGELTTPGERFVGDWVAPAFALSWVPGAMAGWKALQPLIEAGGAKTVLGIAGRVGLAIPYGAEKALGLPFKGIGLLVNAVRGTGDKVLIQQATQILDRAISGEVIPETELAQMPEKVTTPLRNILNQIKTAATSETGGLKVPLPGEVPKIPVTPEVTAKLAEMVNPKTDTAVVKGLYQDLRTTVAEPQARANLYKRFTKEEADSFLAGLRPGVNVEVAPVTPEVIPKAIPPEIPTLTSETTDDIIRNFGEFITSPESKKAWEATTILRQQSLTQRVGRLQQRVEQLVVEGKNAEEAITQATSETMGGKYPYITTMAGDITESVRQSLFSKVYYTLKDEPLELVNTSEALRNALLGKPIPRKVGIAGKSAYTRLVRVFGEKSEVMKALSKGQLFGEEIEAALLKSKSPIPPDAEIVKYLRSLRDIPAKRIESISTDPAIQAAVRQRSLIPLESQSVIIRSLKEIGLTATDIGNFLRANKASFDFSFWRQQAPLIMNNKKAFFQANIQAWKALLSQKAAEESWTNITRDPLYALYEKLNVDFLRPLHLPPSAPRWKGVEEYGYLQTSRLIPRLTEKIPYVKVSERAFVTGANEHNWRIFKNYYNTLIRLNEQIASGEVKSPKNFSIEKSLKKFGTMLEDMSGRAQLGKASVLAQPANSFFFALRYNLGRMLSPRHLVSGDPLVRKEAWKNFASFIGTVGSVVLLGKQLGIWDVEFNRDSAKYMQMRIGNTWIDPWGGYARYVVLASRLIDGTGISARTGEEFPIQPLESLTYFLRGSAAPFASIIMDFWTGKSFIGETVDVKNPKQWIERLTPFMIQDMYDAFEEDGLPIAGTAFLPGVVGAGITTIPLSELSSQWREGLEEYDDIPTNPIEVTAKGILNRSQYREKNPDIDAKLFILGRVSSIRTTKAADIVKQIILDNKIDPTTISAVQDWQTQEAKRKEMGVKDTSITLTDRLIKELLGLSPKTTGGTTAGTSKWEQVLKEHFNK